MRAYNYAFKNEWSALVLWRMIMRRKHADFGKHKPPALVRGHIIRIRAKPDSRWWSDLIMRVNRKSHIYCEVHISLRPKHEKRALV